MQNNVWSMETNFLLWSKKAMKRVQFPAHLFNVSNRDFFRKLSKRWSGMESNYKKVLIKKIIFILLSNLGYNMLVLLASEQRKTSVHSDIQHLFPSCFSRSLNHESVWLGSPSFVSPTKPLTVSVLL